MLLIRSQTSSVASRSGMCFQPQGALKLQEPSGPRIVVVSLFDGIAALMVGLCRLDCQVLAFASSEVDKECKRLVRKRWPGVIELGDIEKIDRAKIEALHSSVGYSVDFVLVWGWQPLSGFVGPVGRQGGVSGV